MYALFSNTRRALSVKTLMEARTWGVSLDIRSTGIKQKGDGPAMIFGVVMLAESRDFAELVAMKARALMKDMNMSSGVIKGNEFNQQG
ncbi:hypothetical protein HJ492_004581 [Escherichia coli]|nr:hypothetical protein [Escherichia coli]